MVLQVPKNKRRRKTVKAILKEIASLRKLDKCTYDGIRGTLPEWMPRLFVDKFNKTRSKLLTRYSYTPSQIKRYITKYPNHIKSLTPEMVGVEIPGRILDDIDELYVLKHAVEAGKQEGLSILLDGKTAADIVSGQDFRKTQSEKASKPRNKIGGSKITINQIICKLALSNEHKEASHKELWKHFFWKLEEEGLDPEEKPHASDLNKIRYLYNFNDNRKSISFGRFVNVVTKSRNK